MKSIKIEKFGGPEVLKIQDIEVKKPGPKPGFWQHRGQEEFVLFTGFWTWFFTG